MGEPEVNQFLTDLAVTKKVSASTQNQALSALLFLYRYVLNNPLLRLEELVRAKKPKRLPVVMTKAEVKAVLSHLEGTPKLIGLLLYGTGMRSSHPAASESEREASRALK
jgi:site-specific recombinase XerD